MKENQRLQLVLVGSCILSAFVGFIGGGLVGRATASSCDECSPQRSVLMHTVGENAATVTGKIEVVCNVEILSTVRDSELAVCNYDATKSTKTKYTDGMATISTDCVVAECIEDKFVEEGRRRRRLADGSRCQERAMKFRCPNTNFVGSSENFHSRGFQKNVECDYATEHLKAGREFEYYTRPKFKGKMTARKSDLPQKKGQNGFVHCEYQDLQGVLHDLPIFYWQHPEFSFFAGVSTEGYAVVYRQLFGVENVTHYGMEIGSLDEKGQTGEAKPDWITIMAGEEQTTAPPRSMQNLKFYVDHSAYPESGQSDVMVEFMQGTDGTSEPRLACCPPIKAPTVSFDALWEGEVPRTFDEAKRRIKQATTDSNHVITKAFATLQTAVLY